MNCGQEFEGNFLYSKLNSSFIDGLRVDIIFKQQMYNVKSEQHLIKYFKNKNQPPISPNVKRYKCIGCKQGVVTSNDSTCGNCETEMCLRCMRAIEKSSKHICNPDDIKSVNEIKKTSKNCPTCLISISKIEGCDQMFCTECHTPFSYNTGKRIEREFFHNPHYTEFLEKNPGKSIFNQCNETDTILNGIITKPVDIPMKQYIKLIKYFQTRHVYITYIQPSLRKEIDDCSDYSNERKDYILGNVSDAEFKIRISKLLNRLDQCNYWYNLNQIAIYTITDIMASINDKIISMDDGINKIELFVNNFMKPTVVSICTSRGWFHNTNVWV
jgi:hypothetical protein